MKNNLLVTFLLAILSGVLFSCSSDDISRNENIELRQMFSLVNFKVQTASMQMSGSIEGISLCNIKSIGTIGFHKIENIDNFVSEYPLGMATDCSFYPGNAKDVTDDDGALLVLPQSTTKWATVDGVPVSIAEADAANNSYIKISCKIKNGSTYLVGSESSFGEVYIPFAADWEIGKKYVYTINIGTGTSGFDVNGNPLIQPISYSVDAEEWN